MARNLTTLLNAFNEHQGFAIAQNQGIKEYLWNGLGLTDVPDQIIVATTPDFRGPHLDLLVLTRNEIWREVL